MLFVYVILKELRIYNFVDFKGVLFCLKYRNGNLYVDGRIFFWFFKIDKLIISIYMYYVFVFLINWIGIDIIVILVFKLELNKCFIFYLYYKYYDSLIYCYCDLFYIYWYIIVGSLGFCVFLWYGLVLFCLCFWKCCFCILEKGYRIKWYMLIFEISKIIYYWEIK